MNAFSALRPMARVVNARAFSTTRSASDLAKMHLIGRVIAQPEKRQTKNGKDFCMYKVATQDPSIAPKEGEERAEPTSTFHTIFAYGPSIDRLMTIEKGTLVHVEALFTIMTERSEAGDYKTNVFATHERLNVIRRPNAPAAAEESE